MKCTSKKSLFRNLCCQLNMLLCVKVHCHEYRKCLCIAIICLKEKTKSIPFLPGEFPKEKKTLKSKKYILGKKLLF